MQKDDFIQLHLFLLQVRSYLENTTKNGNLNSFLSYDELDVGPHHVHKSKRKHQLAVWELSKGIAHMLKEENNSAFQKIYDRLDMMCNRFK